MEECAKCPFELGDGLEVVEKAEDYIHEDERLCTDLDEVKGVGCNTITLSLGGHQFKYYRALIGGKT